MAVPSSGELSLKGIVNEIDDNDYTSNTLPGPWSLIEASDGTQDTINTNNDSSDRPDGSAPHAMSEFYSYNHDEAPAWNNNTDWYSAAINTTFWNSYAKFRIDFGYNSSWNGSGTVNEVESWGVDSSIMSSGATVASTSTTTPGYIVCDGSGDFANSWGNNMTNLTNLAAGGGTLIMIWFRKHTDHNGTLFSISDNSSNILLEMNTISSGAMVTRVKDTSGNWQTRTSTTTGAQCPTNNVWECYISSFDTYSGGKGATYRITSYLGVEHLGSWSAVGDGYAGTGDCLSGVAFDTVTAPYGIGGIPTSGIAGTNVFDGDIALVTIMKNIHYGDYTTGSDAKLNTWISDTHEKMGL